MLVYDDSATPVKYIGKAPGGAAPVMLHNICSGYNQIQSYVLGLVNWTEQCRYLLLKLPVGSTNSYLTINLSVETPSIQG